MHKIELQPSWITRIIAFCIHAALYLCNNESTFHQYKSKHTPTTPKLRHNLKFKAMTAPKRKPLNTFKAYQKKQKNKNKTLQVI